MKVELKTILKEFERFHPRDSFGVFGKLSKGSSNLNDTSLEIHSVPAGSYNDIKQFIKQTITEVLDECIGEEWGKNDNTDFGYDQYIKEGYELKRQEIINIKNKLI